MLVGVLVDSLVIRGVNLLGLCLCDMRCRATRALCSTTPRITKTPNIYIILYKVTFIQEKSRWIMSEIP